MLPRVALVGVRAKCPSMPRACPLGAAEAFSIDPSSAQVQFSGSDLPILDEKPQPPVHALRGLQRENQASMRLIVVQFHRMHLSNHVCLDGCD